jgi:hypothetical protein
MDAEMMADHTVAIEISSPIIEALAAGRETRTAVLGGSLRWPQRCLSSLRMSFRFRL